MTIKHNLIVLTKDKSLDTWIFKLLTEIKSFVLNNNTKNLLESSYTLPEVKLKADLNSNNFRLKFVYLYKGVYKNLFLELDSEDNLSKLFGYEGIILSMEGTQKRPYELKCLYHKLNKNYTVFFNS